MILPASGLCLSIALILGDSHGEGYPGKYLQEYINTQKYETINISRSGYRVFDVVGMNFYTPGVLTIIFLGSNDHPNLKTIIYYKHLKSIHPKALLIGPPAFKNKNLNERARKVAKIQKDAFGTNFVDSYNCTRDLKDRTQDQIHFTKNGAEKWLLCISKQLLNSIEGQ